MIGIHFAGPQGRYGWSEALYRFHFVALINRGKVAEQVEMKTNFGIRNIAYSISWINYWSQAGDSEWANLGDPDNAVGIPLIVEDISSSVD